jgi:hypothetical protein
MIRTPLFLTLTLATTALSCGSRTALDSFGTFVGSTSDSDGGTSNDGSRSDAGNEIGPSLDAAADARADVPCTDTCVGSCSQGACVVTLATNQEAASLAVDDTDVYWTVSNGGTVDGGSSATVMKVGINGGDPVTLSATTTGHEVVDIAIDATNAYWTEYSTSDGAVLTVPKGGGATTILATGQKATQYIGAQGGNVYWTAVHNDNTYVMTLPLSGGTPSTFTTGGGFGLAVDAIGVYLSAGTGSGTGIEVVPLGGGTPTQLVAATGPGGGPMAVGGVAGGNGIAVDGTDVYWIGGAGGLVVKVPKTGGSVTTLNDQGGNPAWHMIAVHDGNPDVYWTLGGGMNVDRAPTGGGHTSLINVTKGSRALAVDATSLYWADNSNQTVRKLTPTCACP